ncbi:hypothetical protein [Segatella bryantii]|uniref:hypothetical protein n=1 Tax=Segatella bryantii TaxID=77095 RepID=UPI00242C8339|nr:hypothetical protein [Segatella bryantii]
MRIYDGAMLHATNKQNVAPGELGQVVSLDLGSVPEEVVNNKVAPLIGQLANVLSEYKVYPWLSIGWHEEDTENKL